MRNKKKTKHTKRTDEIKKLAGINWSQLWEKRCPAVGVDKLMMMMTASSVGSQFQILRSDESVSSEVSP